MNKRYIKDISNQILYLSNQNLYLQESYPIFFSAFQYLSDENLMQIGTLSQNRSKVHNIVNI